MRTRTHSLVSAAILLAPLAIGVCVEPATAQRPRSLKSQLRQMERAAKKDAAKLADVAKWAKVKGLERDVKRIAKAVLKLDDQNEIARNLLGFVRFDGEWMEADKAAELRRKKVADEMKAKGMVSVDGIWVKGDEVEDAKNGVFRHEDRPVTKAEKQGFQEGKIRHPEIGVLIDPADLAKAEAGQFPTADGWVDLETANEVHSNPASPWVYRGYFGWLVATVPYETLKKAAVEIDSAFEHAGRVLGAALPEDQIPTIVITSSDEEYIQMGTDFGGPGSAYGAFLSLEFVEVPGLGSTAPIIANYREKWGPYYCRHAAGMAAVAAWARSTEQPVPEWFLRGVAGLVERHRTEYEQKFFGQLHVKKGGVPSDMLSWFDSYAINAERPNAENDALVYQAGLNLDFAMNGGNEEVTAALSRVTKAFEQRSGISEAIRSLQSELITARSDLSAYLRKLTSE